MSLLELMISIGISAILFVSGVELLSLSKREQIKVRDLSDRSGNLVAVQASLMSEKFCNVTGYPFLANSKPFVAPTADVVDTSTALDKSNLLHEQASGLDAVRAFFNPDSRVTKTDVSKIYCLKKFKNEKDQWKYNVIVMAQVNYKEFPSFEKVDFSAILPAFNGKPGVESYQAEKVSNNRFTVYSIQLEELDKNLRNPIAPKAGEDLQTMQVALKIEYSNFSWSKVKDPKPISVLTVPMTISLNSENHLISSVTAFSNRSTKPSDDQQEVPLDNEQLKALCESISRPDPSKPLVFEWFEDKFDPTKKYCVRKVLPLSCPPGEFLNSVGDNGKSPVCTR